MPARLRWLRVSVRQLVETVDPVQRVPRRRHTHIRWQRLRALWPLSTSEVFAEQRRGRSADWGAAASKLPTIEEGWQIVTYLNGARELTLDVVSVRRAGRQQVLMLKRRDQAQS